MEESYIGRNQVFAAVAWMAVVALMGSGVLLLALAPECEDWAKMLALCGCATSALAATLTIRGYAIRACALVRATAGLDRQEGPRLMR